MEITQLPAEVVEHILRQLSTSDLLYHCRLVCSQWDNLSTGICRKRNNVWIVADRFYKNLDTKFICRIFRDTRNLPWSSLQIQLSCGYNGCAFNRQIAKTFGWNINCLKVAVQIFNYENLFYLLQRLPNLQNLQIIANFNNQLQLQAAEQYTYGNETIQESAAHALYEFPPAGTVSLPRLKVFKYSVNQRHSLNLVKFILSSVGSNLSSVKLQFELMEEEEVKKIIPSLRNIENVKLDLPYHKHTHDFWELLDSEQYFNIHHLSTDISQVNIINSPSYDLLTDFLSKCQKLTKLSLSITTTTKERPRSTFKLPILPFLDFLDLRIKVENWRNLSRIRDEQLPAILEPFKCITPLEVPNLTKVQIICDHNRQPRDVSVSFKNLFRSIEGMSFDTVTQLMGNDLRESDNWTDIFPNLKRMIITILEPANLECIFKYLQTVEYLCLKISTEMDIELHLPKCMAKEKLNFRDSRTLVIMEHVTDGPDDGNRLSDSGAALLLALPPLHLKISGQNLSDHIITKLKAHHNEVNFSKLRLD